MRIKNAMAILTLFSITVTTDIGRLKAVPRHAHWIACFFLTAETTPTKPMLMTIAVAMFAAIRRRALCDGGIAAAILQLLPYNAEKPRSNTEQPLLENIEEHEDNRPVSGHRIL